MDCRLVDLELIAYHFGTLSLAERDTLEAHLTGCSACVQNYIRVKRGIELGDGAEEIPQAKTPPNIVDNGFQAPRPSEVARLRLRAAVEKKYAPMKIANRSGARFKRFLHVPVPLYQIAAVLIFALLAVVFHDLPTRRTSATSQFDRTHSINSADHSAATSIDGSNPTPMSVNYL